MIKTLIIDDSATVRQTIGQILSKASGIDVIGAVQDPLFALQRMEKEWPDVIVLDIEMPRMDGLTFLKKIMAERPTPVVMCSTLTESGSAASIRALSLGAIEVVAKPKMNLKDGLNESSQTLINAVRAASKAKMKLIARNISKSAVVTPRANLTADAILPAGKPMMNAGLDSYVIAIGTSTGGTQALETVLTRLPRRVPAIAIVQHMPEKFTRAFADRLNSICEIDVKEAENNDVMRSGQALIAPGGRHMIMQKRASGLVALIKDGPPVSRHRPSVDVLFRSVAKEAGKNALGIIMTGMGDDGACGLKEMRDAGAMTLAQDQASCVVYGMPAVAVQKGGVDEQIPLESIASHIVSITSPRLKRAMV